MDVEADIRGVGPWPGGPDAWARAAADDARLDPDLLERGDSRNVEDRFRYWSVEAIVAELDRHRHPFHVAIENFAHDMNIGSVVRSANAFLAAEVHVIGQRRWNRRGAMVTERYQHVRHHPTTADFAAWARVAGLPVLGIDNIEGSVALETYKLPQACVLLFGQEGPGLTTEASALCTATLAITQFGSTRSLNAGAAAAIAMHAWIRQHAQLPGAPR